MSLRAASFVRVRLVRKPGPLFGAHAWAARRGAPGEGSPLAGVRKGKFFGGTKIIPLKRKPPRNLDAGSVRGRLSASPWMRRCEISAATYEVAREGH